MKVSPLVACPSCGDDRTKPFTIGGDTRLNQCAACGLVYAPEYADPDEVYVDGYLSGESELGFGLDIFHPYFQALLGYAADLRMSRVARFRGPPGLLLDVGCGSGEVLLGAMRQGWTAVGVEPVEESAKIAQDRGLDVRSALLEESGLDEGSFDIVTAYHVLEHMREATSFVRMLARYVRPGGYVVVEVPNLRSVHRIGFGADWPGLRPLEHICHFSPSTLAATFRRAGLQDVKVRTGGFLWRGQTLIEALNDLGLRRWIPRLLRFAQDREVSGRTGPVPGTLAWAALRATHHAYDVVKLGSVVQAAGRVP